MVAAALVGGAVIGGAASNAAAKKQSSSANRAAEVQEQQSQQAMRLQDESYREANQIERDRMAEDQRRYEELAPYRRAGLETVDQLNEIMSGRLDPTTALQSDPGYQFRLRTGEQAVMRAQTPYRMGGRAIKELQRYGQDYASNEYTNFLNNRFRLAGFGGTYSPSTSSMLPQLAANQGNFNAQMAMNQGNIQAQLAAQQGNIQQQNIANINNAVQGGLSNYLTYQAYKGRL